MSTILVLGGGGFLANFIARHYQGLGWRVIAIGRGARPTPGQTHHVWQLPHPEFAHLLAVEQPELCVNAAGRASVPASVVEPLADFEAATVLNFRILDDLRRRSPQTAYIHISSAAVYGNPRTLPVSEHAEIAPISPYGWHKRMSELVLEEHARLFGMRTASLRVFSAYGACLQRQVVWDLAVRALTERTGTLQLQGCPEDSRDFIHAADVASAVTAIATRGALAGEAYNVAGGSEVAIADLARLILRIAGSDRAITFDNVRRPGNPARWHADVSALRSLGFRHAVSLDAGLPEVVESAEAWRRQSTPHTRDQRR